MNWFKKKKRKADPSQLQVTPMKAINYPPKIIIAWAKSIEGNKKITIWLQENGYEELAMATSAIYLQNDARDWLQNNGFPHLMAMINAAEGNESAQKWLFAHQFETLYHIALAVENEQTSWAWLKHNSTQDLFILAQTIKIIKDKIEYNHNDIHSFQKDL